MIISNAYKIAYLFKTVKENKHIFKELLENGYEFKEALDLAIEVCRKKSSFELAIYETAITNKENEK
jgi:hypothetical protein